MMRKRDLLFSDSSEDDGGGSNAPPGLLSTRTRHRDAGSPDALRREGEQSRGINPPRSHAGFTGSPSASTGVTANASSPIAAEMDVAQQVDMRSLFAEDALRARQTRTTTLRYDEAAKEVAAAARVAAVVAHNDDGGGRDHSESSDEGGRRETNRRAALSSSLSSAQRTPLSTAAHALVQAYNGEEYAGTCVAALCVPNIRNHRGCRHAGVASAAAHIGDSSGERNNRREIKGCLQPLLALVDATKRTLCRMPLRTDSLPRLSRESPQYVSFSLPSSHIWSIMFRDRREAVEFVVAAHVIVMFAPDSPVGCRADVIPLVVPAPPRGSSAEFVESSSLSPSATVEPEDMPCVHRGGRALFAYRLWRLTRVGRHSPYLCVGKTVDEVPAEAPQERVVGDGAWMAGLERAAIGMRAGEARLVFLSPPDTRVRKGWGNPEVTDDETFAAYLFCARTASTPGYLRRIDDADGEDSEARHTSSGGLPVDIRRGLRGASGRTATPPRESGQERLALPAPAADSPRKSSKTSSAQATAVATPATAAPPPDTNQLLQQLLLQRLLEDHSRPNIAPPPPPQPHVQPQTHAFFAQSEAIGATAAAVARVERATDRMQAQLLAISDRLDRLDIPRALSENNTALERTLKRVVGLAPQNEDELSSVLPDDATKDRCALLATVERYRTRYDEASGNYQKALEAMGRYADRANALENDLRAQQEAFEARMQEAEERARLRQVEAGVRHREELARAAAAAAAGATAAAERLHQERSRSCGAASASGEEGEAKWKTKCATLEQEVLHWRTEVQESQGRHIRERRSLQAELDSLRLLCERMGARQEDLAVRVPEESAERQTKRLKRALNAVYANVEAQLAALTTTGTTAGGMHKPVRGNADRDSDSVCIPRTASQFDGGNSVTGTTAGSDLISVENALSALIVAITSEARAFTQEIKAEAALRGSENAMLAQLRADRREAAEATAAAAASRPIVAGTTAHFTTANDTTTTTTCFADDEIDAANERALLRARDQPEAVNERIRSIPEEKPTGTESKRALAPFPSSDSRSGATDDEPRRSTRPFAPGATTNPRFTTMGSADSHSGRLTMESLDAEDTGDKRSAADGDAETSLHSPSSPPPALPRQPMGMPSTPTTTMTPNNKDAYANNDTDDHTTVAADAAPAPEDMPNSDDATPVGRPAVRLDFGSGHGTAYSNAPPTQSLLASCYHHHQNHQRRGGDDNDSGGTAGSNDGIVSADGGRLTASRSPPALLTGPGDCGRCAREAVLQPPSTSMGRCRFSDADEAEEA